ncbi:23847_t:CDS:1, partial [Cetraspora pellucida]
FTYFKDIASQWLTIKLSDRSVRTKAKSIKENIDSTDITYIIEDSELVS